MKIYTAFRVRINNINFILIFICFTLFFNFKTSAQSWHALTSGTNLTVFASTVYNGNLIIGGDFTTAGGVTVNRIAQWNGSNWSTLGTGMDSVVLALSVFNGELIAAGKFTTAGGTPCNKIAQWNGTSWSPLGLGANDIIYALCVFAGSLRVGGSLTSAGGVTLNHIGRWDGTSWYSMSGGVNDVVYSLSLFGSDLILGGRFTLASGIIPVKRIADYNVNGLYTPLGSGVDSGAVLALYTYNNSLIAGGDFTSIGGITIYYIASWNGSNWINMGTGMNSRVRSLNLFDGNLIISGRFTNAGGIAANYIAGWNGTNYFALGSGMSGGTTEVTSLCNWSNILIAGGNFTSAGGTSASNVAAWGSTPNAPSSLNPCGSNVDSLDPLLSWNAVSNATSYGLQVAIDPNFSTIIINQTGIQVTQYQIQPGVLNYGTTYYWRVNASNGLGPGPWSSICSFTTNPLGISNTHEVPKVFRLYQNYPNPFNPETIIRFDIPASPFPSKGGAMIVTLKIYDILGSEVVSLIPPLWGGQEGLKPGSYEIKFNGTNLPSGIYFYKIFAGNNIQTNKMVLLK